jgi:solute:Na+ symporter, SSS family
MAVAVNFGAIYQVTIGGYAIPGYSALYTLILNLVIAAVLTPVFRALKRTPLDDETVATDYYA